VDGRDDRPGGGEDLDECREWNVFPSFETFAGRSTWVDGNPVDASWENGEMAKEEGRKLVASNRKARHDYHVEDTWEAGLVLMGTEVKSLRQGRATLSDGFAEVDDHEVWLHGVHIPEYTQGTWTNHSARRRRKLLLNRTEIDKIERKITDKGYTLVPLALYFKDGRAKVEIALARGKKT
jgi:SsrA-binding protein